jgi:hypothetical protein
MPVVMGRVGGLGVEGEGGAGERDDGDNWAHGIGPSVSRDQIKTVGLDGTPCGLWRLKDGRKIGFRFGKLASAART